VLTVLIHKKCPNGIDVFYDNAGEEILDAAIANMNTFGNIILCGATATYNQWKTRAGLTNLSSLISKRVKAYGIIYYASRELAYQGFAEMF
jgi:NADPH-dependent curcumin reductase CurA